MLAAIVFSIVQITPGEDQRRRVFVQVLPDRLGIAADRGHAHFDPAELVPIEFAGRLFIPPFEVGLGIAA